MSDNHPMAVPPEPDPDERPPGPYGTLSLAHSTTVDRVVEELHRALFEGELEPGTPLREMALAEAIGVSRSTIREALGALVAEGLATREPNRGVHVTELDKQSVHDVCDARAVLEIAGVRRWRTAQEDARDAVRSALVHFTRVVQTGGSPAEMTAAHLAVHRSFVGLTGSARLISVAEGLSAEVRLGLAKVDRIRRNTHEQLASHRGLLHLLERGDIEAAAEELEQHLANAESSMLQALHLPAAEE
jgi:DNA-binding GntR family transcriptional regulator